MLHKSTSQKKRNIVIMLNYISNMINQTGLEIIRKEEKTIC